MAAIIPVGIDLGTTFSVAAFVDESGRSQLIPVNEDQILIPSVAFFENDHLLVGWDAWRAASDDPSRLVANAKRDMGSATCRDKIVNTKYPPEVVQGCILRYLNQHIKSNIGKSFRAVVTVPAYFDEARRHATIDAAAMSGLEVLDLLNEPTAAALAFGEKLGYLSPDGAPKQPQKVLVYDLGGGTFDVTVVELDRNGARTLATDGDFELGGIHWDERLVDAAEQRYRDQHSNANELSLVERLNLTRAATKLKHDLTRTTVGNLRFGVVNQSLDLSITRNEFEQRSADLLERTLFTTKQAVQSAGLIWSDIDQVLLVGGSTRMPAISRALEALSGIKPESVVHPDEAVARGAAIFARHLLGLRGIDSSTPEIQITNVNAHGIGIEGVSSETLRVENTVLIPKNTPLPFEIKRAFVTRRDNQTSVKVRVLEGNSSMPEQCSCLATAAIRNMPPGLPKGSRIDVVYRLDSNGRLTVEAAMPKLGAPARIKLERTRAMPGKQVEHWKQVLCKDGGYSDFEEALSDLMNSDSYESRLERTESDQEISCSNLDEEDKKLKCTSIFGLAPSSPDHNTGPIQADKNPSLLERRRRVTKQLSSYTALTIQTLFYLMAPIIGLAVGYYLLCSVRPDLNFLDLEIPGLIERVRQ